MDSPTRERDEARQAGRQRRNGEGRSPYPPEGRDGVLFNFGQSSGSRPLPAPAPAPAPLSLSFLSLISMNDFLFAFVVARALSSITQSA